MSATIRSPIPIKTLRYVSFRGHSLWAPLWDMLIDHDISLTYLGGNSFYNKEESLEEIARHHKAGTDDDFSELIAAIQSLPDDVLVEW